MKWKPYPSYKDSGVEWLGRIPAPWEARPLKHVTQFVNGAPFKPTDWGSEGVPIIRIENLNGGEAFNRTTLTVNRRYEVQKGDILFGWSGNRGTSFGPYIWPRDGLFYLNQHIFRLEGFQAHQGWFYWMLKAVTLFVEQQAHGIIGLVHITKGDLGVIKIPLPSHDEQQAIASFLDRETGKIDALVKKKERLIELLQEKRTALISHAVTQGLNPNAPKKDSGIPWLGHIPKHWQLNTLKHTADFIGGGTPSKDNPAYWAGDIPWVSPKDMKAETVNDSEDHITMDAIRASATSMIPSRSVLVVVRSGILKHTIPVAINTRPVALNQDMKAVLPKNGLRADYLAWLFRGLQSALLLEWRKAGATVESLEHELIARTRIPRPSESEQLTIASFLDRETAKLDALMAKVRTAIERLQECRTALISAAVTGQIDVRGAV